jgi:hypothetical protein
MPSALAKEVLETAEQNPKIQILHKHTGKKAFEIAKSMFKADEAWASQFTSSQRSHAFAFLYSRMLIKNKIIGVKLIIGKDSVLGETFPYEKGMNLYEAALAHGD